MPQRRKDLPKAEPWKPANWEVADAGAIQALMRGDAAEHQQRRAIKFIVETLCGTYDLSFRSASERDTCFAEGKRFVGLSLVKLSKLNLAAFKDEPSEQG